MHVGTEICRKRKKGLPVFPIYLRLLTIFSINRVKEDQTKLITARLEHLQFMMASGNMPIFRHRSDMFLFALEAYNIARGLSSRYYRMQVDMDIRFFIRFQFDNWLNEIHQWIEQLGGVEYQVEDENFFPEGRAKRLTIVVDKLFGYHLDKLPADSADGSMPLPDEEILEPFRAILQMKSSNMVGAFRKALQEVHEYMLKLAMMPVDWPEEKRKEALRLYLKDSKQKPQVLTELRNYKYFCCMPDGKGVKGQFCYLKQRLLELTAHGELSQLKLSKNDQEELLGKLRTLFSHEETSPSEDQIPANEKPMADDELFAMFLYFVKLDGEKSFPVLDEDKVSNYLIRKDVYLTEEQEMNLQALFALMDAMKEYFDPILESRFNGSRHGINVQERIDGVLNLVKKYNNRLTPLIAYGHNVGELDAFFERLFSADLRADFGKGQDQLLELFEKDRDKIKLKPYVQLLRVAADAIHPFVKKTKFGNEIYNCLKEEDIMADVTTGQTIIDYWGKTEYKSDDNWKQAIKLVEAVENEYKQA